ncbi:MAG: bifunctional diaminohydroxyphosphoribosylaminopyrimidine deaminase/5-amino-6-(5-phosphoribosylamino)uracil reductase RibD [Longimicrobiales bacterium]
MPDLRPSTRPPAPSSDPDRAWLERARGLGRRGWGHVHPNPMVGCVLVRDGRVVGEGWHEVFGGPHAEIVALEAAGAEAEGATAFVSLEPCNHHGKTPPCADALLRAGVGRVVYGAADPGPASSGGGARLAAEGVDVAGPLWSRPEAVAENPAFFHNAVSDRPFVALKLAMSLDGGIAAAAGEATGVTGPEARDRVHALRSGFDAVLVGSTTARVDDPLLTVRHAPAGRVAPRRLVLDARARLPTTARMLRDVAEAPVHVFTGPEATEADLERLEGAGAHVHPVPAGPDGRLDLPAVLDDCAALGLRSILCEGGGRLGSALLAGRHVQRLILLVAPVVFGPDRVPAFPDASVSLTGFRPTLTPERLGRDTLLVLDRVEAA